MKLLDWNSREQTQGLAREGHQPRTGWNLLSKLHKLSSHAPSQTELRRTLLFFQVLSLALALALGYHVFRSRQMSARPIPNDDEPTWVDPSAPYASDVKKIIDPLGYSFLPILSRSDVQLRPDFKNEIWILTHIHLFDQKGQVALQDDRYGLCGDLAAYAYQKVEPLLRDHYTVRYVRAAESHYFPAPLNTHYVLSVIDQKDPRRVFILDPTFKRYGPLDQFDEYLFFEHLSSLRFMARQERDNIEIVNRAIPVLISRTIKLSLIVLIENGQFNEKNFSVGILATHKNTYMPRTIYRTGVSDGKRFEKESAEDVSKLPATEDYTTLKRRVNELTEDFLRTIPTYTAASTTSKK